MSNEHGVLAHTRRNPGDSHNLKCVEGANRLDSEQKSSSYLPRASALQCVLLAMLCS